MYGWLALKDLHPIPAHLPPPPPSRRPPLFPAPTPAQGILYVLCDAARHLPALNMHGMFDDSGIWTEMSS